MKYAPTISVVMAVYNARPYLADAIESVLHQDYTNFELTIVDDGSTDGGHEIVARFQDPRICLIRTENRGLSAARNLGIERSSGAYVTFLDGDDLLTRQSLSSRVRAAEEIGPDCVFCRNIISVYTSKSINLDNLQVPSSAERSLRIWSGADLVREFIEGRLFIFAQAFVISRQSLKTIGGFDENIRVSEDVEFLSRLLPASPSIVETLEPCYVYRRRVPNSLSAIRSRQKAAGKLRALQQAHRNLAQYLCGQEIWQAQTLFSFCVEVYPYWTAEHRLAMREARRLRGDRPFDLACVGGPRAQAVARLLGWRAGRLWTYASSLVRGSLSRLLGSG